MPNTFHIQKEFGGHENVAFVKGIIGNEQIQLSVFSYLVDGVLIDTGASSMKSIFQSFFLKHTIEQVVLTHFHEDHTGNARWIQDHLDVPIAIHQMSTHLTTKQPRIPLYRKKMWGDVEAFHATPLSQTFQSTHDSWSVIETPGHTKDHVAFLNETNGYLFTGDLFVAPKVKIVLMDENVLDTLASLKKIQTLNYDTLFCCHAGPIDNPQRLIQYKIDYLEELQGKVLDLAQQGFDVFDITKMVFPTTYPIEIASHTEWSSLHIVRTFLNEG